jgi:hypothetical protein
LISLKFLRAGCGKKHPHRLKLQIKDEFSYNTISSLRQSAEKSAEKSAKICGKGCLRRQHLQRTKCFPQIFADFSADFR